MGVGKFFPGRAIVGLARRWPNAFFQERANSGEILFYQLDTKRQAFSTKKLMGKYQISKPSGGLFATIFRLLVFCS